jgi:hypothetical protein
MIGVRRGQFDSQKSIENSTQQAFAQGVRAGGDDWFKIRLKTLPSDLQKSDFGWAVSQPQLARPKNHSGRNANRFQIASAKRSKQTKSLSQS